MKIKAKTIFKIILLTAMLGSTLFCIVTYGVPN